MHEGYVAWKSCPYLGQGRLCFWGPMAWLAEEINGFEAQHLRPWCYEVIGTHMSEYLHTGMSTKQS
jgi:hypothetical protein